MPSALRITPFSARPIWTRWPSEIAAVALFLLWFAPQPATAQGFGPSTTRAPYASPAGPSRPASKTREYLTYNGRYAYASPTAPEVVHRIVDAANRLQRKPYVWGGGHRYLYDRGYDCSGAASYVLHQAGLLRGPMTAKEFKKYGAPGPGRFITIYAAGGHVFMSVCGLRFDTTGRGSSRDDGPRWRSTARTTRGYIVRHPPGL